MPSISFNEQTHGSEPALSQTWVMRALAAIDRIRSARDAAECLDWLFQATQAMGANASVYTVAIPEHGTEPSSVSLYACNPTFAQLVFDLGSVESHPWVRFARAHTTPGTARQVQIASAQDAAAMELARAYGFGSYLIVPTIAGPALGRIELLCLGKSSDDSFDGEDQRLVRMLARSLAAELHDWFAQQLRIGLQQAARLLPQDVQLLTLEWEGLSTKEISLRTGMSIAAVDSRFQRLNQRLNCPSRKASARRAAEHSVLEPALSAAESGYPTRIRLSAGTAHSAANDLQLARDLHRRSALPASPG